MTDDEKFMKEALKQAKKAYAIDEVPIGCVIVQNGKIIARGYNRRNIDKNTLAHAELSAIRKASKKTGDWRACAHCRSDGKNHSCNASRGEDHSDSAGFFLRWRSSRKKAESMEEQVSSRTPLVIST